MTCLNQHWISYKPLSKRQFKPYENPTLINGENIQTTINNTKHPQYNHTLPHNIPSQTKFNLNIWHSWEKQTLKPLLTKISIHFSKWINQAQPNWCLFSLSYSNTNASFWWVFWCNPTPQGHWIEYSKKIGSKMQEKALGFSWALG